jgi:hypothetical protein
MIRNVDHHFGRVRAALAELGLEDNTLLIFTSDNGPCSGSQPVDRHMAGLHGLKGTVYENGIRAPVQDLFRDLQKPGKLPPSPSKEAGRWPGKLPFISVRVRLVKLESTPSRMIIGTSI